MALMQKPPSLKNLDPDDFNQAKSAASFGYPPPWCTLVDMVHTSRRLLASADTKQMEKAL
jgi:hypothetical protein